MRPQPSSSSSAWRTPLPPLPCRTPAARGSRRALFVGSQRLSAADAVVREHALLALSLVHDFLAHYSLTRCTTPPPLFRPCAPPPSSTLTLILSVPSPPPPQHCCRVETRVQYRRWCAAVAVADAVAVAGSVPSRPLQVQSFRQRLWRAGWPHSRCCSVSSFPSHRASCSRSLGIPAPPSSSSSGQSLLERLIAARSSPKASSSAAPPSVSLHLSKSTTASKFNFAMDAAPQSKSVAPHVLRHVPQSRAAQARRRAA
jgi:hypothetical protein